MKSILLYASEPFTIGNGISEKIIEDRENLIIITGDLIAKNSEGNKFKYINYNYYLDRPPFKIEFNLDKKIQFNLKTKILSYNRKIRAHRKIMCYHILTNPNLKSNTWLSFGIKSDVNNTTDEINFHQINVLLNNVKETANILKFCNSLNEDITFNTNTKLNTKNLGSKVDWNDFNQSFCSLVTETNIDNNTLFISEKTYKPIYAQQPFIVLGNPNTLKYLKEIGFKTFDMWWDESYDSETDFKIRLNKIISIITDIANKSIDELSQIRKDMESVLVHNYKHFLTYEAATDELKKLGYGKFEHYNTTLI